MSVAAWATTLLVKPSVVALGAAAVALAFRKRGAAFTHGVWTGAAAGMLVLPVLILALPTFHLPGLAELRPGYSGEPQTVTSVPPAVLFIATAQRTGSPTFSPAVSELTSNVGVILWTAWAIVALWLLVRRARSEVLAIRLVGRGKSPSTSLVDDCAAIAERLGCRCPALVVSSELSSPAVAGFYRPTLILPVSAASWSRAEREAVLVHELSHVVRYDLVSSWVAALAAAVYWCNPLVHFVAARVREDAERACDDMVLREGADPGAYAQLLLAFARATQSGVLPNAVMAAARPSELESRLRRILNGGLRPISTGGGLGRLTPLLGLLIAIPVAAAAPHLAPYTGEPDQLGDSISAGERLPQVYRDADVMASARRALAGPDSAAAAALLPALGHVPLHRNDLVRERAAWALSQTRGQEIMTPVIEALSASDWRVQAYAAWTVGTLRDERALPRLLPLLEHRVWRVRAMAAYALAELHDQRSVIAMTATLSDPAWQVRSEAVRYLGALPDTTYRSLIRARLEDRHVAVRRAAAAALITP